MFKIGQGWDLHRLIPGDFLTIGGEQIPFNKKFKAHSDGDVLVHALIDSLLGAANCGDIGTIFPPSDNQFKNADSMKLLDAIYTRYIKTKYTISNIDCTIIIEKPKMGPHILKMRKNIAKTLSIDISQISIKAKTHEKADSTGQGESAQAQAVCLLIKV